MKKGTHAWLGPCIPNMPKLTAPENEAAWKQKLGRTIKTKMDAKVGRNKTQRNVIAPILAAQ